MNQGNVEKNRATHRLHVYDNAESANYGNPDGAGQREQQDRIGEVEKKKIHIYCYAISRISNSCAPAGAVI